MIVKELLAMGADPNRKGISSKMTMGLKVRTKQSVSSYVSIRYMSPLTFAILWTPDECLQEVIYALVDAGANRNESIYVKDSEYGNKYIRPYQLLQLNRSILLFSPSVLLPKN
jgi:hypothetical protein